MPQGSPVPSRAAMIRAQQGDPLLGFLIPALGGLVRKFAPKVIGAVGRIFRGAPKAPTAVVGGVVGAVAKPVSRSAAVLRIGSEILKAGGVGVAAGATAAALTEVIGPDGQVMMIRGRRRRMNPLNPKALRRATRRLSSFNKLAKKTQSELAKLAPPRSRRAPARHHHHDGHHHDSS